MTDFNLELRVAEAIAREAGKLMLVERGKGFEVDFKAAHDVVTRVDRLVEDFIRGELKRAFPSDTVHGEEHGVSGSADRIWYVDPIDGTLNFTQGIPMYCVSIGLEVAGQMVIGVIYEPNRDELFSGARGSGVKLNGQRVQCSATEKLADAVLATGFPPPREGDVDNISIFARVARKTRNVRRLGSAAIDLAYVACGRLDGFWEFNLSPWDTAAGFLLVEEAGGRVTDERGGAYQVNAKGIVAVTNGLHGQLMGLIEQEEQ
ncbi:MAG: inositol monophosphatase family protein [bacterium]